MAGPKVTVRYRTPTWAMEEGEETPQAYAANRLKEQTQTLDSLEVRGKKVSIKEKYDDSRFQPGWSGKDAPGADKMGSGYAKKGDGTQDYDDLGASSGKKTSKGSIGKVTVDDIKEAKRVLALAKRQIQEELLDDEFADEEPVQGDNGAGPDGADRFGDEFGGDDAGLNGEDDVPPEMEGDEGFEGEEGAGLADDVTVEIGGQRFSLVPDEGDEFGDEGFEGGEEGDGGFSDEGLEGDEGFEGGEGFAGEGGDTGEEGMGGQGEDDELIRHGGVKAERKDLTTEKRTRVKEGKKDKYDQFLDRAIEEARQGAPKKITKSQLIKHHLTIKNMSERNYQIAMKNLKELFTGEYVLNKQGEPGYDFSPVGGDESFAVVARAASGDQYSPTISKSVWEPDKKGGKTTHAKTVTEDFKNWMKAMQKNLDEQEDPGIASDRFNKNDIGKKTLGAPGSSEADDFVELPELLGKDDDTISQYGEARKRVQARTQKVTEAEQPIKFPSKEVKEDLEKNLKESFDFSRWVNGDY